MAVVPKKTGHDRLIFINEVYAVSSWSRSLGCTPTQLRNAVMAVGKSAEKVTEYLKRR